MKRLSWLLLAVLCAAWAQVQPVAGIEVKAAECRDCCGCCGCGTPGCCPAPASTTAAPVSAQVATLAPARARKALPSRGSAERVHLLFSARAVSRRLLCATAAAERAARAPLFRVHCSFLI